MNKFIFHHEIADKSLSCVDLLLKIYGKGWTRSPLSYGNLKSDSEFTGYRPMVVFWNDELKIKFRVFPKIDVIKNKGMVDIRPKKK